jgi:predicted enzyme related to lactoylglutathione lyase
VRASLDIRIATHIGAYLDAVEVEPGLRWLVISGTPGMQPALPEPDWRTPRKRREHKMDWKLELVAIPVSDVDRAKEFYVERAGFNADHDHTVSDEIRFVQLTPPGSACSIAIGKGISQKEPGSVEGLQVVVDDIEEARATLAAGGVEVSDVQDFPWGRFVHFTDPDGNGWAVQQIVRPG